MIRFMWKHRLWRISQVTAVALLLIFLLAPQWPAFGDEEYQIEAIVGPLQFDFLVWETNALTVKAEAILTNAHTALSPDEQKAFMLDYLERISEISYLEWQIKQAYVDPNISDPDSATAVWQTDLATKRTELAQRQPLAEAIIQDQVATILSEEEFDILNQTWPPVLTHMTPLPTILIISPRDEIDRKYGIPLQHGLSIPMHEEMETAVADNLNLSALVVPIGGLGIYPSMVQETSNIHWLAEVVAHEWAHHWLTLNPLGLYYFKSSDLRTINETVASIVGTEIGVKVIERFYPEFIPPPPADPPSSTDEDSSENVPIFDFRTEMGKTRQRVDELLAEGKIEEAETYMEERRQLFVENGHGIRKLNQAYFAFYGAYADTPGATGTDPIGPLLLDLRDKTTSLREFMDLVAPVTSFEALQDVNNQQN